ncbi:MAG: glycosyltransferase family 61 protein [Alphaproteobacteria bacterium]|nr:MAG: glycosyltransferase family 61 protein [Alphaproteobacteria bacterium]
MTFTLKVGPLTAGERRAWRDLSCLGEGWSGFDLPAPMAPVLRTSIYEYGRPAFELKLDRGDTQLVAARIEEAVWLPRRIIVDTKKGIVSEGSFRRPSLAPNEMMFEEMPDPQLRVPGLSYHLTTKHRGFGHILLEGLSQAWAIDYTAAERLIVNKSFSSIARTLIAPLSQLPIMEVDSPVRFESLIVASQSYRLDGAISARFVEMCQRIREFYAPNAKQKYVLYVSRRLAGKRRLKTELIIEDRLRELGAVIMNPEKVDLQDQIRHFASASVVIGPIGSALYNCVFCKPGTIRIILAPETFHTRNDTLLSAFTMTKAHYLFGPSEGHTRAEGMSSNWTIPADVVVDTVRRLAASHLSQ